MNRKYIPFGLALLFCLTPFVSSPIALVIGFLLASFGLVPTELPIASFTKKLLSYSIVGLGFGINFEQALSVTSDGIGLIIATIVGTLVIGSLIAKVIKLETTTAYLISSGTAICGGSAIAAVAPAIRAKDEQIGLALATVFVLNSLALFIFPVIGHALNLDQHTFGTWAAIAIHDTSSVVGAASAYGEEALTTATTLKLARALWIIPVALISAVIFSRGNKENGSKKLVIPYFIFWYCAAIAFSDFFPQFEVVYHGIFTIAKQALVVCLFLIGCSISISKLKSSGPKPLLFGVTLWVLISTTSLSWLVLR
ncbi:TPA: putative sulfate exporter family transporter [Vibrio parahaemolyticus]|uniref:YeiH family protein n=1 Tax=Vibrio parahaemolyticus TaxID=670 RepID=UPI0009A8CA0D|nr:putative sulfate exporter family transporter [Vibrio parahaemolyticus]EGR1120390.1 putative sulfate exporter family transporter [Vibrio parahaemolyticus]EJE4149940.1 putative sulfate exporter family transporter [Vibrio parahaemolyticus]ELA9424119.1 putative sulfate exporter family transporter [Vibrio parahaemolyticus]ELU0550618.1 putative sulfate exporter family transporter [Vibrio parahaemolyticus]MBM4889951.1 putative sulfate exporter family transporter [Vibrio parahaemolyticus]